METKTIKLNPHKVRTLSFDGWCCSLCWWGNEYGETNVAATLADYFFSTDWKNGSLPSLEMNIVRYNVGSGGGWTVFLVRSGKDGVRSSRAPYPAGDEEPQPAGKGVMTHEFAR